MNQVTLGELFVMTKCLVDFMLFYCVCFYLFGIVLLNIDINYFAINYIASVSVSKRTY